MSTVKHEEFVELYAAYVDGELAPAQREAVELHLSACPECQTALNRFARERRALVDWRSVEARWQPNVRAPVLAQLEGERRRLRLERGIGQWGRRFGQAAGLAFAALLLLLGVQWLGDRPPRTAGSIPPEARAAGPAFLLGRGSSTGAGPAATRLLALDVVSGTVGTLLEAESSASLVPGDSGQLVVASEGAEAGSQHLTIVDAASGRLIAEHDVPPQMLLAVRGQWAYFAVPDSSTRRPGIGGPPGSQRSQSLYRLERWDLATGRAVATIPTSGQASLCYPADFVVAPDGEAAYWLCDGAGNQPDRVVTLDLKKDRLSGQMDLPSWDRADRDRPRAAIAADGGTLFVRLPVYEQDGVEGVAVAAVSLPSLAVREVWPLESGTPGSTSSHWRTPRAAAKGFGNEIVRLADGRLAIMGDPQEDGESLYLLDPRTGIQARIATGQAFAHIAASASHRWLFATTFGEPAVVVVDVAAQRVVASHPVPLRSLTALAGSTAP